MTDTAHFIPAPEVVDQLRASVLPREAKAAMTAFSVETLLPNQSGVLAWPYSWSPFRCCYGFKEWTGSLAAFPDWGGGVGPSGQPTSAFGVWQDERETDKEISALTGVPGVAEQDQIAKNWVLAVRDFAARSGGGDLLKTLQAGELDQISPALAATWPEGADNNFPARYRTVLALFNQTVPPPAPAPPPPPPTVAHAITLRLGMQESFPIAGVDQDGNPFTPPDALTTDDPKVCSASVVSAPDQSTGTATIATVGVGQTRVHGADLAIAVTVEAPRLAHLRADFSKAVVSRIPPMMAAMAVLLLLAVPTDRPPPTSVFSPSNEAAKSYRADRGPKQIGDPTFCAGSGSLLAMERCLRWTAALSRR